MDKYNSVARRSLLQELTASYLYNQVPNIDDFQLTRGDFFVDIDSYFLMLERISEIKTYILRCYLFFCKGVTYEFSIGNYYLLRGDVKYSVPSVIVHSFFFYQMYNDIDQIDKVLGDWRMGIDHQIELIPMRQAEKQGQMKILIDAVLAVDAMILEEGDRPFKILIAGSSHDPTLNPKYSYSPIEHMITGSEIHMYDYIEEEGVYEVNGNKVYRYRRAYDYRDIDQYDLILDDTWSYGKPALDTIFYKRFKNNLMLLPDHYSIKSFSEVTDGAYYHQIVKTATNEVRLVSRPLIPYWKSHKYLGSCAYCRELKFFLSRTYNDSFYEAILRTHNHYKCYPDEWFYKTKEIRAQYAFKSLDWEEVKQYSYVQGVITVPGVILRRRVDDTSFRDMIAVEMREEHLRLVSVIVSRKELIVKSMLKACAIYYYDGEKLFRMKLYNREVLTFSDSKDFVMARMSQLQEDRKLDKEKDLRLKHSVRTYPMVDGELQHGDIESSVMYYHDQKKYKTWRKKELIIRATEVGD